VATHNDSGAEDRVTPIIAMPTRESSTAARSVTVKLGAVRVAPRCIVSLSDGKPMRIKLAA